MSDIKFFVLYDLFQFSFICISIHFELFAFLFDHLHIKYLFVAIPLKA